MGEAMRITVTVRHLDGKEKMFEFQHGEGMPDNYVAEIIKDGMLMVELDDRLVMIPLEGVEYLEFSPKPLIMPGHILKGGVRIQV